MTDTHLIQLTESVIYTYEIPIEGNNWAKDELRARSAAREAHQAQTLRPANIPRQIITTTHLCAFTKTQ